jgi:GNAT superfamily N-acetyltransferase
MPHPSVSPFRHAFSRYIPFDQMSPHAQASVLEGSCSGCHEALTKGESLQLVSQGAGQFIASHAALAFVVFDPNNGDVHLRYLVVARRHRRRGAGRALVAKLRAVYAGRTVTCSFPDGPWTRFARSVGFEIRRQDDGQWHATTQPAGLEPHGNQPAWLVAELPHAMSAVQPSSGRAQEIPGTAMAQVHARSKMRRWLQGLGAFMGVGASATSAWVSEE